MGTTYLTVSTTRDERSCVLAVRGELDAVSASDFLEHAAHAVAAGSERLVLDLGGLTFTDCRGARALAAAVRTVPDDCPVTIRAISPALRRILDLTGIELSQPRGPGDAAVGNRTYHLIRQMQTARSWSQDTMTRTYSTAQALATTQEKLAATLARLAERKPDRADRLMTLSQAAHQQAERHRELASRHHPDGTPASPVVSYTLLRSRAASSRR